MADTPDQDMPVIGEASTTTIVSRSSTPPPTMEAAPTTEFIETISIQDKEIQSMLPPRRRSLTALEEDISEEVAQPHTPFDQDTFQMTFGLWCQDASITRQQYASLLEVLSLLDDKTQIHALPRSIETLRRKTRSHLPLMKIRKKSIPLIPAKLPTAGSTFRSMPTD